jgi:hypothetical protein
MHFFRLFHENFTTVGQLDGVILEARIRYREVQYSLHWMQKLPLRSTVNCKFDVLLAFQICLNFDKRLWDMYPHAKNLSVEAILHVFLTFPLWPLEHYSPSYRSTSF